MLSAKYRIMESLRGRLGCEYIAIRYLEFSISHYGNEEDYK